MSWATQLEAKLGRPGRRDGPDEVMELVSGGSEGGRAEDTFCLFVFFTSETEVKKKQKQCYIQNRSDPQLPVWIHSSQFGDPALQYVQVYKQRSAVWRRPSSGGSVSAGDSTRIQKYLMQPRPRYSLLTRTHTHTQPKGRPRRLGPSPGPPRCLIWTSWRSAC